MEISGSFPDYLSLLLGKPRIRLNNLKTLLRFPCLCLNPIIDSIILTLMKIRKTANSHLSLHGASRLHTVK